MKPFKLINAGSLEEAIASLQQPDARVMAGGTDMLGVLKGNFLPQYPGTIVNIGSIKGLDYIKSADDGTLRIGALTRLADIAESDVVKTRYSALFRAARKTASHNLRNMGTIGGNICQFVRCWYMRGTDNFFFCTRKGGETCYADIGDNRYHSIFGGVSGCISVNCSDVAPALVALNAQIVTTKRKIPADAFWSVKTPGSTALSDDELVTEVAVPPPPAGARSAFIKFSLRNTIGFPIVNCAAMIGGGEARVCLNAVYPKPYRAVLAEELVKGRAIDEELAEQAGEAAIREARPRELNAYKVQIAKVLVKRTILACSPTATSGEGEL